VRNHKKRKRKRMKLTREKLEKMANVEIQTVDISTLTDLKNIEINTFWSVEKNYRHLRIRRRISI
jgi:hypothetical protein